MKTRKRLVSVLAGVMAAVLLLTLLMSILPTFAGAASSGEIRKQIIALQQERKEVQNQIADVKKQYKENLFHKTLTMNQLPFFWSVFVLRKNS